MVVAGEQREVVPFEVVFCVLIMLPEVTITRHQTITAPGDPKIRDTFITYNIYLSSALNGQLKAITLALSGLYL